jgi:anti-sigma B factor antagonist
MPLELRDRRLGRVVVVKCAGRIVAGVEGQDFEAHITSLCAEHRDLVLDVADVAFVDSSGLGTLVRLMARIRRAGGDLKLCAPPPPLYHLLKITNLLPVFDVHQSDVSAVSAFYQRSRIAEINADASACRVLCIHSSVDTLAYLREVLRRSGYDAVTTSNLPDAIVLLKATSPSLVILAGEMETVRGRTTLSLLQDARPDVPVLLLQQDFSRQEAGQAGSWLLEAVRTRLANGAGA